MEKTISKTVNFDNAKAKVTLPKGARNIRLSVKNFVIYIYADCDENETDEESYSLYSFDRKQDSAKEEGLIFLKEIYHLAVGYIYFYYKKD